MLLVKKMGQLYQLKLDPEEGSKDPDVQEDSEVSDRRSKTSDILKVLACFECLDYPKAY